MAANRSFAGALAATVLLSTPGQALLLSRGQAASETDKNRPVSKVINLLKDMLDQLEKEGEEDEAVYAKMECWCKTNDREKTAAISSAETRISNLNTDIEEFTANSARLSGEIVQHEKEVAQFQEALKKATALRNEQLQEFNGEEKSSLEAISALKGAVTVLSKHQSLLQVGDAKTLHRVLSHASLSSEQRRLVTSFLQSGSAQPAVFDSYANQSGGIYGVLTQLLEEFENNLSASQKEENDNQKAYEDLKAAKEEEIRSALEQMEAKKQLLADTDEKNAAAQEDLADTKESLTADEQFLMMLKEKCSTTDKEWDERQNTRRQEMAAVSKALEFLSSDDAADLFAKNFNPALVQTDEMSASSKGRRAAAARVLQSTAAKLGSKSLSVIAEQVKLDAFVKVKKAIDDMIAQLLKQHEDERKHYDYCLKELHKNEVTIERERKQNAGVDVSLEDHALLIKGLQGDIDRLKDEIAEMQLQMKRAGEDREIENKEFQQLISEQRATQRLLKGALRALEGFYGKSLMQQAPPAGFKEYKNNEFSGGVMAMITKIIEDSKAMEVELMRSEADAQAAYEAFVKMTNLSIDAKQKEIINKSEQKAKLEGLLIEIKKTKESVIRGLEQLSSTGGELHQACDFILRNFKLRQQARMEEIEALRKAKAILSGAKFD